MPRMIFAAWLWVVVGVPATAQEMGALFHNVSRTIFSRNNGHVEIRYDAPRPGLPVREGTLLLSGTYERGSYFGTAYIFKRGCEPLPYAAAGKDSDPGIVLVGVAPRRDPRSCAVIGDTVSGKTLVSCSNTK